MMMILLMQAEPTDTQKWTTVEYDNDGVVSDDAASGVLVNIYPSNTHDHARVSAVTMDACVPRPRNNSHCLMWHLIECRAGAMGGWGVGLEKQRAPVSSLAVQLPRGDPRQVAYTRGGVKVRSDKAKDLAFKANVKAKDLTFNPMMEVWSSVVLTRDAMLARYMLSSCVCLSVRPSVRHKPVLYQNG